MRVDVPVAATVWVCAGCGTALDDAVPPLRCPHAGTASGSDGADHVLNRVLRPGAKLTWSQPPGPPGPPVDENSDNPFLRYRGLLYAYHVARAGGMSDADYVSLVLRMDARVAEVDGRGFRITPFSSQPELARAVRRAAIWVKDETGNVSGSHKARHLFGIAIYFEVLRALGREAFAGAPLAIASCGNAALAAAVVARAAGRALQVFVPPSANPNVLARLQALGANVHVTPRAPDSPPGDPCYHAFRRAVDAGAVPFACQGPDAGLTIDGGRTLGYEIADGLADIEGIGAVDDIVVQVGGGALGSAVIQALGDAVALGVLPSLPRLDFVQTRSAWPLMRAYGRIAERILVRLHDELPDHPAIPSGESAAAARAALLQAHAGSVIVAEELRAATERRAEVMWPWETEPHSIAHGILDDETYDWRVLVEGMIRSGGRPVVVGEEILAEANRIGRETTDIDVDATGTAGLAGLMQMDRETPPGEDATAVVIFSGVKR